MCICHSSCLEARAQVAKRQASPSIIWVLGTKLGPPGLTTPLPAQPSALRDIWLWWYRHELTQRPVSTRQAPHQLVCLSPPNTFPSIFLLMNGFTEHYLHMNLYFFPCHCCFQPLMITDYIPFGYFTLTQRTL